MEIARRSRCIAGLLSCVLPIPVLTACCVTAASPASAAGAFSIIDLGSVGEFGTVRAINELGQVLGEDHEAGHVRQAFLWSNGARDYLSDVADRAVYGYALNDLGQIVGVHDQSPFTDPVAFIWQAGVMTPLNDLTLARDINNDGIIMGRAIVGASSAKPVLFDLATQSFTPLPEYDGHTGSANALNNACMVVGSYNLAPFGAQDALVWSGGDVVSFDAEANSPWTTLLDVNDHGVAVGYAGDEPGVRPFLWSAATGVTDFGFAPISNPASLSLAINNHGVVVGRYDVNLFTTSAYMYANGVFTDLNDLLPDDSPWTLLNAVDINDRGQIIGIGELNGERRAFLFQVPGPAAFHMMLASVLWPTRRRRRRA